MRTSAYQWPSVCPGSTPSTESLYGGPDDGAKIEPVSPLRAHRVLELDEAGLRKAGGRRGPQILCQGGGPRFTTCVARHSSHGAQRWSEFFDNSLCEVLHGEFDPGSGRTLAACLTHASGATNRLRAGQSRERVSNTWVTCPDDWDNPRKLGLIPNVLFGPKAVEER